MQWKLHSSDSICSNTTIILIYYTVEVISCALILFLGIEFIIGYILYYTWFTRIICITLCNSSYHLTYLFLMHGDHIFQYHVKVAITVLKQIGISIQ